MIKKAASGLASALFAVLICVSAATYEIQFDEPVGDQNWPSNYVAEAWSSVDEGKTWSLKYEGVATNRIVINATNSQEWFKVRFRVTVNGETIYSDWARKTN